MTKLLVAFRSFASAPKTPKVISKYQSFSHVATPSSVHPCGNPRQSSTPFHPIHTVGYPDCHHSFMDSAFVFLSVFAEKR